MELVEWLSEAWRGVEVTNGNIMSELCNLPYILAPMSESMAFKVLLRNRIFVLSHSNPPKWQRVKVEKNKYECRFLRRINVDMLSITFQCEYCLVLKLRVLKVLLDYYSNFSLSRYISFSNIYMFWSKDTETVGEVPQNARKILPMSK